METNAFPLARPSAPADTGHATPARILGQVRALRRRSARIRPYVAHLDTRPTPPPSPARSVPSSLLFRVLDRLRCLPDTRPPHAPAVEPRDERTPLVRLIDAQRARTAADRTPTQEIPVVGRGVSWR